MDLSPNDIRNYEFSSQMRGYDKEDVDSIMEQIAVAMEEIKQANLNLSMELDSVKSQLQGLRQFEDTIKSAAIDARRNADLTMENAKQEAELLLGKANNEAEKIIENKSNKIQEIENHISQLELTRRSYMTKLKGLINSHLDIVDEISKSELPKEVEKELLEITASNEVESETRSTVTEAPQDTNTEYPEEQSAVDPLLQNENSEEVTDKEPSVDPELAAAINSFDSGNEAKPDNQDEPETLKEKEPEPAEEKIDPSTGWVETKRSAEEVPPEFIVNGPADKNKNSAEASENDSNGLEVTRDQPALKEVNPLSENLAEELDKVAAKFEEEMDKAEK